MKRFKFLHRPLGARRAQLDEYDKRVQRWEEAMRRWERSQPPVIIKVEGELTDETAKRIRETLHNYYRKHGVSPR